MTFVKKTIQMSHKVCLEGVFLGGGSRGPSEEGKFRQTAVKDKRPEQLID